MKAFTPALASAYCWGDTGHVMARQKVESGLTEGVLITRRWIDAWNRSDLDAFFEWFGADAEVVPDPSWMEAGPYRGSAAIREWFEGLNESWDERNVVALKEVFEAGDRVLARFDWQVRGRASGIEMDFEITVVNTFENGKIVHQQYYFDHAQALRSVGADPPEGVTVVRRTYEAFRRRDLETFLGCVDPEVEFRSLVLEVEGVYRGHEGARSWWNGVLAVFPDWRPEVLDAREVNGHVVVRARAEGSGTGSGIASQRDIWQVADVRNARIASWTFFRTEQEALEAVGLPQ
jgi:ketosteroid isomerase-like protein